MEKIYLKAEKTDRKSRVEWLIATKINGKQWEWLSPFFIPFPSPSTSLCLSGCLSAATDLRWWHLIQTGSKQFLVSGLPTGTIKQQAYPHWHICCPNTVCASCIGSSQSSAQIDGPLKSDFFFFVLLSLWNCFLMWCFSELYRNITVKPD